MCLYMYIYVHICILHIWGQICNRNSILELFMCIFEKLCGVYYLLALNQHNVSNWNYSLGTFMESWTQSLCLSVYFCMAAICRAEHWSPLYTELALFILLHFPLVSIVPFQTQSFVVKIPSLAHYVFPGSKKSDYSRLH